MKKSSVFLLTILSFVVVLSSCTSYKQTMREPYARVDFQKEDFTFSEQVTGEASSTKILMIDFARLFTKKGGAVDNGLVQFTIPVIGSLLTDQTSNFALYEMMQKNKGYDVIFYPQYETEVIKPFLGIGFIVKKTNVKATARLAKIK